MTEPSVLKERIIRLLDVFLEPKALLALVSWPRFSITSFKMVSGLAEQGVIPATVIDVGANVGQFAIAAAKIFPVAQVYSIEPNPACFESLRESVRTLANVTVLQVALGDTEGTAELRVNSHSQSSSILPLAAAHRAAFPGAAEVGAVSVKLTTLDKVFDSIELRAPVLLKLDVQGFEAMTLRGGTETLKRVDYAVLEASLRPMYEGETLFLELMRMMEEFGFRFLRPIGSIANPLTGEVLQMDVLFGRGCA